MNIGISGSGGGSSGRASTSSNSIGTTRRTIGSSSNNNTKTSSVFWDKLYKIQPLVGPIVALIIFLYGVLPPTNYYELSLTTLNGSNDDKNQNQHQQILLRVAVFGEQGHDAIARKQEQVLQDDDLSSYDYDGYDDNNPLRYYKIDTQHQILDVEQQRSFIRKNKLVCGGERSLNRFDELVQRNQQHLATELWKYCALWTSLKDDNQGGGGGSSKYDAALFVDRSSPLLVEWTEILRQAIDANDNAVSIAVMGDPKYFPKTIHGSFLYLTKSHASAAYSMLQLIQNSPITALVETATSSLLIQRTLYQIIMNDKQTKTTDDDGILSFSVSSWYLLEQKCHNMDPLVRIPGRPSSDNHKIFTCPTKSEFCCSVRTPPPHLPLQVGEEVVHVEEEGGKNGGIVEAILKAAAADPIVVMLNRHPTLPFQKITEAMVRPYRSSSANADSYGEDELPYISTVRATAYERPSSSGGSGGSTNTTGETKNLYEVFQEKDMLPKVKCRRCLNMRRCTSHESYCKDYMKNVCDEEKKLLPKFVSKRLVITPPLYRRDPSRLVPRILHQTWYETLSQDDYPNMSRLAESFKQSGWEYKFYSDADAETFLATHFPSEVLEAYRALIPGAFKADLFRYCALLIFGGVYADVDILLESNLDLAVEPDIGFMVPMDEPDACVWQGFIAAAPGHPFLAKAIETVVNQVRNRYTSVDIDASFCPTPNFKVLHMFDVLFTAGPCLLGASMNRVLGRHGQTLLEPGDLLPEDLEKGASFVLVDNNGGDDNNNSDNSVVSSSKIPGRTVILKQNKWDMGAHRFTYVDRNIIVAATDLENSDDRLNQKVKKVEKSEKSEDKESNEYSEEGEDDNEEEKKSEETKKSSGGGEHYSKAHAKSEIYGLQGLYVDLGTVDEEIRIVVDASRQQWTTKVVMDE